MPDSFLSLPTDERDDILTAAAHATGRSPAVLEKDVWVCWTLGALFSTPGVHPMAFKGGTSLSKIHGAINRFSEDIDVTFAHAHVCPDVDPFDPGTSREGRGRQDEALRAATSAHVTDVVEPYVREQLSAGIGGQRWDLRSASDGEVLYVQYPTTQRYPEYVQPVIKLEFGGRNAITPANTHAVISYIESEFPVSTVTFPRASVSVLAAERTFWEKVTLVHVECRRTPFKATAERMSRHWYDLYQLADHAVGAAAVADAALRDDVIKYKTRFFNSATASYHLCREGGTQLVPTDPTVRETLTADYDQMCDSGMIANPVPSFGDILSRLEQLEIQINVDQG